LGTGKLGLTGTVIRKIANPGGLLTGGIFSVTVPLAMDAPAAEANSPFHGWISSRNSKFPPVGSTENRAKVISEIQATGVVVLYPEPGSGAPPSSTTSSPRVRPPVKLENDKPLTPASFQRLNIVCRYT